jgi:hypothetical protein
MINSTPGEFSEEDAQRLIDQSVRDMYTRYTSDLTLEGTRNLLQLFIQHADTSTIYSIMRQTEDPSEPIITAAPQQRSEDMEELLQHVFSSEDNQEFIRDYLQSGHTIITSGPSNPNAVTFPDVEPKQL